MASYSDAELELLMAELESDCVERKESAADGRKIRRNICAFANDLPGNGRPGVVLVGVRDDGTCASLPIDDELLVRLSNIRGEGDILPLPSMTVQKRHLNGCDVAVVTVEPSADPPVRYRGRVLGPRRPSVHEGSVEDERLLSERRRAADLSFDSRPANGIELEDLDMDFLCGHYLPAAVAAEVLDRNQRTIEPAVAVAATGAGEQADPGLRSSRSGRDPQARLPGAYVQFLRIDGMEITDPIRNQKQLTGRLDDVVRRFDDLLELNVSVRTEVVGTRRERLQPDYPVDALRQLAYNAVMHRSYEGTNTPVRVLLVRRPGRDRQPRRAVRSNDTRGTSERETRTTAIPFWPRFMHHLGFAQRFGLGVPLARRLLTANGNPEPEFHFEPARVVVIVRDSSVKCITVFNNKGGVGKTSLVYHLAWMYDKLDYNVLVADLGPAGRTSPACSWTTTIWRSFGPGTEREGRYTVRSGPCSKEPATSPCRTWWNPRTGIGLVAGDMLLSGAEDELSSQWPDCLDGRPRAFRVLSALWRAMRMAADAIEADLILVDVGPNLGALNRAALVTADHVVVPPGTRSLFHQGLRNLGPTLRRWRQEWSETSATHPVTDLDVPGGEMMPIGYVVMQHAVRLNRPVKAYERWMDRIPDAYCNFVLDEAQPHSPVHR